MNARERYLALMSFEPVDRTMKWEFGYWAGALRRWTQEGLDIRGEVPDWLGDGEVVLGEAACADPSDVNPRRPRDMAVHDQCHLDAGFRRLPVNILMYPEFPEEVLEDHGEWFLSRDKMGAIRREHKGRTSVPRLVGWAVSSRDEWEQLKAERLRPSLEGRLHPHWQELVREHTQRDYPLGVSGTLGFYGLPRYLLGDENVMTMFYDDPDLMHNMITYLADFWVSLFDQVFQQIRPDVVVMWEDMCFKTGPLISPALFREFLLPAYNKLTACCRAHGIQHIILDTDGNCWQLIPLFLEGGVTGLYPFEVAAGMDVGEVRRAFPRLQMLGGVDKMAVKEGPAAIDRELERIKATLPHGGYVPYIDHLVPMDISWPDFMDYRGKLNRIIEETHITGSLRGL